MLNVSIYEGKQYGQGFLGPVLSILFLFNLSGFFFLWETLDFICQLIVSLHLNYYLTCNQVTLNKVDVWLARDV